MTDKLPVHECFQSWQGEGVHMGRSAYFIRLFGCPVHCPWCDSAGTWHPDYIPKNIDRVDVSELAAAAKASNAGFVVVTGGEPAIHDLGTLTKALHDYDLAVHIETSGGFDLKGDFDWITLSPKWQKLPVEASLKMASELKLIVEDETSIDNWIDQLDGNIGSVPVWLHPEWSQRDNGKVLESITNFVKEKGDPFRAGYQMHKLYRADLLDPRSRPASPLGGDLANGY